MNTGREAPNAAATAKAPDDIRYIGAVSGCYRLMSRDKAADGHGQVFACRTVSISTREVLLIAPVAGSEGDWLSARFDHIGLFNGQVGRRIPDGFAMTFAATPGERAKLAARLTWLKKRSMHAAVEHRAAQRRVPHDPQSVLLLPDNTTLGCFIIDLSRSGVAVSADIVPDIGAPIAVGTLVGNVARHFESGFAVKFAAIQDAKGLEERLRIQPRARNAVLGNLRALVATVAGQNKAARLGTNSQ